MKKFLDELADLMDKHSIALCSKRDGDYSSVFFIKNQSQDDEVRLYTNRLHSTPHELRLISREQYGTEADGLRNLLDAQGEIVEEMRAAMQYAVDELNAIPTRIQTRRTVDARTRLRKVLEPQS